MREYYYVFDTKPLLHLYRTVPFSLRRFFGYPGVGVLLQVRAQVLKGCVGILWPYRGDNRVLALGEALPELGDLYNS